MLKLFVGGISQDTCEKDLKQYFEKFGVLEEILIIRDKVTGTQCSAGVSKGYGFVTCDNKKTLERVLLQPSHLVKGRVIEVTKALDKTRAAPEDLKTKGLRKLFVGGLGSGVERSSLRLPRPFVQVLQPIRTSPQRLRHIRPGLQAVPRVRLCRVLHCGRGQLRTSSCRTRDFGSHSDSGEPQERTNELTAPPESSVKRTGGGAPRTAPRSQSAPQPSFRDRHRILGSDYTVRCRPALSL